MERFDRALFSPPSRDWRPDLDARVVARASGGPGGRAAFDVYNDGYGGGGPLRLPPQRPPAAPEIYGPNPYHLASTQFDDVNGRDSAAAGRPKNELYESVGRYPTMARAKFAGGGGDGDGDGGLSLNWYFGVAAVALVVLLIFSHMWLLFAVFQLVRCCGPAAAPPSAAPATS